MRGYALGVEVVCKESTPGSTLWQDAETVRQPLKRATGRPSATGATRKMGESMASSMTHRLSASIISGLMMWSIDVYAGQYVF